MSKFKVAVSDTTIVNIVASIKNSEGRQNQYKFDLVCKRKGADELKELTDSGTNIKEILREVTVGWRGQRLVLDQDDSPVEFSAEAFDALLDIANMPFVLWNRYYNESGANVKN